MSILLSANWDGFWIGKNFRRYLSDRFSVKKAFIFIGYIAGNESLYKTLQNYGYIIVFKPILFLSNNKVKGNVDAELVLHTMIEYPNYNKAVVVTGDGDFHCLIEYLELKNKIERLIIPNKFKYSSLLRRFSHLITFLNNTKEKLSFSK